MRKLLLSVIAIVAVSGFSAAAKADYFLWQDPKTGLSMSWPDTWKIVSNADPDDIVTIAAPAGRGFAACRVRARADGRYLVYPVRYSPDIQQIAYSRDFWEKYLGEYDDHEIYEVTDGAGLGRGFASYAVAGYESGVQGPYMPRQAIMFATLYNDTAYILECSAHKDAYARWHDLFLSIADSVDFKKIHNELRTGHYRNFMKDRRIEFKDYKTPARVVY